jgi:hypothetical protein
MVVSIGIVVGVRIKIPRLSEHDWSLERHEEEKRRMPYNWNCHSMMTIEHTLSLIAYEVDTMLNF